MRGLHSRWRRLAIRVLSGMAAPALLALASPVTADEVTSLPPTVSTVLPGEAQHVSVLTLAACKQIALERQPALAAARATLAAAADRASALDCLHTPRFLAPDLPIRRQQASLGVTIAEAGVQQAESDILYGVTYSYLAVLYARQQQKTLNDVHESLKKLQDTLVEDRNHPEKHSPSWSYVHAQLLTVEGRLAEAEQGINRALTALREAMGVSPDFCFVIPDRPLPCPLEVIDCCAIVNMALARRGDLIQAATMAQVTGLEVDAQSVLRGPRGRTFASGSDIHARPVPTGSYGLTYRPGALAPEMPTLIPGKRPGRISQAHDYLSRAEAVADKTRGLVAAEAEEACLHWKDLSVRFQKLRAAAQEAHTYQEHQRGRFDPDNPNSANSKVRISELINTGTVTTQLRIDATEAQFRALVSLAMLERVTACGFVIDFDALPPCSEKDAATRSKGTKTADKQGGR